MFHTLEKIPPLRKIHGGKYYLARRIISLFNDNFEGYGDILDFEGYRDILGGTGKYPSCFVDCTIGGGSVLYNINKSKYPFTRFIAADIDKPTIMSHSLLSSKQSKDLIKKKFENVIYSEDTFNNACKYIDLHSCGIKSSKNERYQYDWNWLKNYIIKYRFSRGGLGKNFAYSDRLRGGKPGDVNAWDNFCKFHLYSIAEESRKINSFDNFDVIDCIDSYDSSSTIFYIDLPYPHDSRTACSAYACEMATDSDHLKKFLDSGKLIQKTTHKDVLERILYAKGRFYVSSYHNFLYDSMLKDWHYREFDMPNHSGQGDQKERRTEVLWSNHRFIGE